VDTNASLAPLIKSKMPALARLLKPVAAAYTHIAGYRQMGLKYDDLLIEEREDVQKVSGWIRDGNVNGGMNDLYGG